ncbi:phosphodiester glycosidase family protein [Ferdinandcohnia quinoae]|uniref:S-layer homology domain-containing protein n=1 Tax=Fredinandcohnia quinoae TaxID=2918902 RepID=A0AAW5E6R0_9BACI|nr:phosphodiester glycosidase family protein [Fredinandcohnia sp. SECRCQ15]MCH1625091.1 S-layer homology domain-containing protein [Fredinandcohnia sp. SECRCQ15]
MAEKRKILSIVVVATLIIQMGLFMKPTNKVSAQGSQFQVSTGVKYSETNTKINSYNQALRVMEINLQDPYTQLDLGLPSPLNSLATTSKQAIRDSKEGHQVVGAINGSFFDMSSKFPMYLLSYNNQLVNAGVISSGFDQYVNKPVAFGVTADGKALIDSYDLNLSLVHNGVTSKITSMNKIRNYDDLILYTPEYGKNTNSNKFGMEVVITNASKNKNLAFGDVVTGTVSEVKPYGEAAAIPEDGLVLSAHGTSIDILKGMQTGDQVSISLDIDAKWKNSKFMVASGPVLVSNGQVKLGIDPNSSRAKERAPRTAVAVDKTLTKVFFVTVDGRQEGYSKGMNLKEFAEYLVKMGAYQALNLDGGGSTAMVGRKYGNQQATLLNKPSDGRERAVSTTLQAISTAPIGEPKTISAQFAQKGKIAIGASVDVNVKYILDQYYNTLTVDSSKLAYSASSTIGNMNGKTFTASKAGTGNIVVKSGNATASLPITVVDKISKLSVSPATINIAKSASQQLSVKGYDASGDEVIINASSLKWNVPSSLGTITKDGKFQASSKNGSGTITATYGNLSVKIPVQIGADNVIVESFDTVDGWSVETARATASLVKASSSEPKMQGTGAAKLSYDFSNGDSGTAAAYLVPKKPITFSDKPDHIGIWTYGDGNGHWLRGLVTDGNGKEHTIDFTEEGGLDWVGWKYAKATLPSDIALPIQVKQVYVVEPSASKQGKGTLYFDKLQAVYSASYIEPIYTDVPSSYPGFKEIKYLSENNIISGYGTGDFRPGAELRRVDAAILISKALNLNTETVKNVSYKDVPKTYRFYNEIAAVSNAGIMNGKNKGTTFDPNAKLTRAEMAVILQKAFKLKGNGKVVYKDVSKSSFAYDAISALYTEKITVGYADNTYRPGEPITRAQYSYFLYRCLTK